MSSHSTILLVASTTSSPDCRTSLNTTFQFLFLRTSSITTALRGNKDIEDNNYDATKFYLFSNNEAIYHKIYQMRPNIEWYNEATKTILAKVPPKDCYNTLMSSN